MQSSGLWREEEEASDLRANLEGKAGVRGSGFFLALPALACYLIWLLGAGAGQ